MSDIVTYYLSSLFILRNRLYKLRRWPLPCRAFEPFFSLLSFFPSFRFPFVIFLFFFDTYGGRDGYGFRSLIQLPSD